MHFKVVSDLHVDINRQYQKQMKFDPNAFYLIAGDISGDRIQTTDFLISKDIKGVFVEGNHFGYNATSNEELDTKEKSNEVLRKVFEPDFQLEFLENNTKVVDDYVIVGCTLYTDFNLFGNVPLYSSIALRGMNDFRYVMTLDEKYGRRRVNANDYIDWHKKSIAYIDSVCQLYSNKKIIVVTHHAPSIESISREYVQDLLTPAYASNLEQFIFDRPNIKLWCHGHVHHITQYNIGEAKIVCNPFGYYNENNMNLDEYLGVDIEV